MLTGHVSMTGESRAGWRISESVQPGGRPPAPGSLALRGEAAEARSGGEALSLGLVCAMRV